MDITSTHRELLAAIKPLILPWRKMTIAIDGVDDSGKSTLARFLAWQLGMPALETDTTLPPDSPTPTPNTCILRELIRSRHLRNRPVIVEGIVILGTLQRLEVVPEFLVRVEATGRQGSSDWHGRFTDYERNFPRILRPDFLFTWVPHDSG
jgi:hypothetical protein